MALTNQYIIDLRAGKINVMEALRNPQTTTTYTRKSNATNLDFKTATSKFLTERGYSRDDFVPNSVLKRPTEKSAARKAAEERTAQMITVSNNSKNLPNYTAQTQRDFSDTTQYNVQGNNNRVSNNNVIANELWVDPNVTVTGQSRTSKPSSSSIAANENYNTATAMNDFISANPSSDINIGSANPQPTIWWKSAAPEDNSVQTSDLGGDIQHQETDNYTNVSDLPLQNQVPSDTNWASPLPSIGTTGIVLGGIAALLLLGKKN